MWRKLIIALGLLAFGASARGVSIGLEWMGNTFSPLSGVTLPNTPLTMRMYIQNGSSVPSQAPVLEGVGIVINAWFDAACTIPVNDIRQVRVVSRVPGWHVDPANNNTYFNGLQFAVISGPDFTVPPGKTYLMDIDVTYDSLSNWYHHLTINRNASVIVDETGGDFMTNDAIWYPDGFATVGKGRWGFGNWGGGKWQRYDSSAGGYIGQGANPLMLYRGPEPTSVSLLGIGVMALAPRRPHRSPQPR